MGMRFLKQIVAAFAEHKPDNYPVAIIQNGTTKAEKVVLGTLATIEKEVREHAISNPANIIFGPAVLDQVTQYKNLKSTLCYR
jgi:uroporphyrin-III C-methyltransferase